METSKLAITLSLVGKSECHLIKLWPQKPSSQMLQTGKIPRRIQCTCYETSYETSHVNMNRMLKISQPFPAISFPHPNSSFSQTISLVQATSFVGELPLIKGCYEEKEAGTGLYYSPSDIGSQVLVFIFDVYNSLFSKEWGGHRGANKRC